MNRFFLLLPASQGMLKLLQLFWSVFENFFKNTTSLSFSPSSPSIFFLKLELRFVKTNVSRLLHFEFFHILTSFQICFTLFLFVHKKVLLSEFLSSFLRSCFSQNYTLYILKFSQNKFENFSILRLVGCFVYSRIKIHVFETVSHFKSIRPKTFQKIRIKNHAASHRCN